MSHLKMNNTNTRDCAVEATGSPLWVEETVGREWPATYITVIAQLSMDVTLRHPEQFEKALPKVNKSIMQVQPRLSPRIHVYINPNCPICKPRVRRCANWKQRERSRAYERSQTKETGGSTERPEWLRKHWVAITLQARAIRRLEA